MKTNMQILITIKQGEYENTRTYAFPEADDVYGEDWTSKVSKLVEDAQDFIKDNSK